MWEWWEPSTTAKSRATTVEGESKVDEMKEKERVRAAKYLALQLIVKDAGQLIVPSFFFFFFFVFVFFCFRYFLCA
jgi:hypothetical protein